GNFGALLDRNLLSFISDKELALIVAALLIIIFKVVATSLTLVSGGNGGVIAPSLFTGAITGFFLAHLAGYFGVADLNHSNFIVVGMAGILSGVLHSPLTGIFLIAEVTGGYILIVPLMIVPALSFFISRYFHPHSIYTTPLFKSGIRFRSEREKYFLHQLNLSDIVETNFVQIKPNATLRQLVQKFAHTRRNLFPVVDDNQKLVGIVTLDDVREYMFDLEVQDIILVYEIMKMHFDTV